MPAAKPDPKFKKIDKNLDSWESSQESKARRAIVVAQQKQKRRDSAAQKKNEDVVALSMRVKDLESKVSVLTNLLNQAVSRLESLEPIRRGKIG